MDLRHLRISFERQGRKSQSGAWQVHQHLEETAGRELESGAVYGECCKREVRIFAEKQKAFNRKGRKVNAKIAKKSVDFFSGSVVYLCGLSGFSLRTLRLKAFC